MKCKNCEEELEIEKFRFRKDTNKYSTTCKKCINKISWKRKKEGLVKKRVIFDFVCSCCKIQKIEDDFYLKDKKNKRYDTTCKECRKEENKEWHMNNREKSLENKKKWHELNRESNLIKFKENYKIRILENPIKEYEDRKKWRLENKDKINEKYRQRYATDINFKLATRIRNNCNRIIKKGCKKNCKTIKMLDCDIEFVKEWLYSQFTIHMNWENQGSYWHIDHFFPVACFDLTKPEEQNKCFHWTNLQPLTKKDNLTKNSKMPSEKELELHLNKIFEFCEFKGKEEKSIIPEIKGSIYG